ncbi:MAG: hypothetical protein ACREUU_13555 [Gammaproteobacteria bacterium]
MSPGCKTRACSAPTASRNESGARPSVSTIETKDGRTLDGLIAAESAASLTLKRAEGVTETVLRHDIAEFSASGLSLMPEGLEAAISVDQMADLLAFLLEP